MANNLILNMPVCCFASHTKKTGCKISLLHPDCDIDVIAYAEMVSIKPFG